MIKISILKPVKEIKGVGPAKESILREQGIATVEDLLYYFPRRYIDRSIVDSPLEGQNATLVVTVQSKYMAYGKKSRVMVQCKSSSGVPITLVFFRSASYFMKAFEPGQTLLVSGKVESYGGRQMVHPDFEFMDDEDSNQIHMGRMIPLYPSTDAMKKAHLDSRGLRRIIHSISGMLDAPEILDSSIIKKYNFLSRGEALQQIHYPDSPEMLEQARRYLKYEELFLFQLLMRKKSSLRKTYKRILWPLPCAKSKSYNDLITKLPFKLTGSQNQAIQSMLDEITAKDHSCAFLLQGDVGSGKTLVALSLAMHYADNGVQSAILAPTEVLARQHYLTFIKYIGLMQNIRIELITGSDKKKAKETVIESLKTGETDIVIGTHALLEESITFASLGFVIIDEQHRFGVEQREAIRSKGKNPDLLAMTATPIPRTLCLTEFSDLTLVTLTEKPSGRKPIKTMWLTEEKRTGLYKSIRKYAAQGRQCYIVYPIIEESEKMDLRAATDAFEELKTSIFPDFRVELLHGRMKADDKERIMRDFRSGDVKILVSTTVIEVGVDVPNATIMVIEHADRFGISQLHQLRGRVGRGSEESFCILMSDSPASLTAEAKERLEALVSTDDGFALSEIDLRQRGPGMLLGTKQHGVSGLRIADLIYDKELAEKAFHDAFSYMPNDIAVSAIRKQFEEGNILFPN